MQRERTQIQPGWNAYDNTGDKIGEIVEIGATYVVVQKGLFLPSDVYVPLSAMTDVSPTDESVTLNIAKGDIDSMGWNEPPTASTSDTAYDTRATGTTQEGVTVPLREEQLEVGKNRREAGEVRVGKNVTEQVQEMDVPVTRETVEVNRRRVDRPATGDESVIDDGETVRIPVTAEDVEVRKNARVVEEVEVTKRPVTETQRVSETVRREELDVDESGGVLTGSSATNTSRTDWQDDTVSGVRRSRDDDDAFPEAGGAAAGAVGGAAVGAAVGGPPGAVVGGAVGAAGGAAAGDAVDDDEDNTDYRG